MDTLLTALREVIKTDHQTFPAEKLELEMAVKGKSLVFGAEEIKDLLDMEYGDRRLFPLLSLLYSFVDTSQLHHIDHFFPYSAFQKKRMEKLGCDTAYINTCQDARTRLANLVLLEGTLNTSKNDTLPAEWMKSRYPNSDNRKAAEERLDLGTVPASELEFMTFFEERKEKLQGRLEEMLLPKQVGSTSQVLATV